MNEDTVAGPADSAYRVLARKYRPTSFDGLIGQDALVRTLTNAIRSGRLAHAWLLTGVRGVGKTTTARIIARALNCIGPDGQGGPTPEPCGVCANCTTISEDRHVDVLEMDAASRTGVDDVRELIEGVRYRPVSARYKVYIIDEVHMLSNNAFNALLKTLEEPPEHVKFIFATTESRKIPITVLSRCQRFDLRRVGEEELAAHLGAIAQKERVSIDPAAMVLIARAADGSVRDALSILDQAIAHGAGAEAAGGGATISEVQVREMLGLADRTRVFDLFEAVMKGQVAQALAVMAEQHGAGADAATVIEDLLDLAHWITRIKVAPDVAKDVTVPEAERVRGAQLAGALSMPVLARAWQLLLKGLQEAQFAPDPMQAAEMVLVRLAYASDLPPPADLVKRLSQSGEMAPSRPAATTSGQGGAPGANGGRASAAGSQTVSAAPTPTSAPASPTMMAGTAMSSTGLNDGAHALAPRTAPVAAPAQPGFEPMPTSFREAVTLFARKREGQLHVHLTHDVHPVSFEAGRIEFRPRPEAPKNLPNRLSECLSDWTGQRWFVGLSDQAGQPTLAEQDAAQKQVDHDSAAQHPFVRAALQAFPGAKITEVRVTRPAADFVPSDGETPDAETLPDSDDGPIDDGAPPPSFEGEYPE
jgi:DNA polymerase-3 subunit gamma/tau